MTNDKNNKNIINGSSITDIIPVDSPSENFLVSEYLRRMPNIVSRGLLYLVIAVLLSASIYSVIGKIDVIVEGRAIARPMSHKIKVLSDRSGFLEQIFITEGQTINNKSPLFLIRSKEGLKYKTKVDELRRTIPFKEEHYSIKISTVLDKLNQLNSNFTNIIKVKRLRSDQNHMKLNAIESDLDFWKQELRFRVIDRNRTERLLDEGIISVREHDRISINVEKAETELKKLDSQKNIVLEEDQIIEEEIQRETANYTNEKSVLEKEITNLELEKKTTLNTMYNELEMNEKMLSLQNTSSPGQDKAVDEEKIILAENSGTISELHFKNTGEYIRESDLLCTIIPANSPLYMDITVANKDIGFIEENLNIKYKFDAFPYSDYGILSGTVTSISPSAVEDKNLGFVYHVHGLLEKPFFVIREKTYSIKVGMTATAELVTERKSIFSLLFQKLKRDK